MSQSALGNCRIAGISTCVPERVFDNLKDATGFEEIELKKVISLAGVAKRHISDGRICSSDLCYKAAEDLIAKSGWEKDSIDGLIFVTQTPDYLLPSTSCMLHKRLGLSDKCSAFDIGLGCSGYPYGLWMAAMMINSGHKRVLLLHGETPSVFTSPDDRATFLLFGDAGTATAVEYVESENPWYFTLQTDGQGYADLIIPAGGFRDRFNADKREHHLYMNGSGLFNFTIQRVPPLISDTLEMANRAVEDIDYFAFHQSNRFIMKHLMKKCGLSESQVPVILEDFGNTGGPSVALAITQGACKTPGDAEVSIMLLGYGVGLSWSAGLVQLDPRAVILHSELSLDELDENQDE